MNGNIVCKWKVWRRFVDGVCAYIWGDNHFLHSKRSIEAHTKWMHKALHCIHDLDARISWIEINIEQYQLSDLFPRVQTIVENHIRFYLYDRYISQIGQTKLHTYSFQIGQPFGIQSIFQNIKFRVNFHDTKSIWLEPVQNDMYFTHVIRFKVIHNVHHSTGFSSTFGIYILFKSKFILSNVQCFQHRADVTFMVATVSFYCVALSINFFSLHVGFLIRINGWDGTCFN